MKKLRSVYSFSPHSGLTAFLSVLLVFSLLAGTFTLYSNKVNAAVGISDPYSKSEDIKEAKQEKKDTEEEIAEAKSMIKALSGELSELKGELKELQDLNDAQRAQYITIAEELAAALLAKNDALAMYLEAQETLELKNLEYSERISVMFEFQNKSTLEILLESDNLAGFFTNLEIVELIADSDHQIMEEMKAALDDAQLKSDYALQEAEDMQAIADQKRAELLELEAMIGKTEDTLKQKKTELSKWEKKQDDLEAESKKLDDEIARLQRELYNGGSGGNPPNGKFTWPYPGDYKIYSPYGMRFHPVYKVNKMHWGVDLGGSYGNPIVAAADGTVILVYAPWSGQNKGGTNYGNYLVIDHGGGVSTLYAHCKYVDVQVGDKVVAGQAVARCGSTGTSTGPHLHFEVRVNGSKVNPANYIT